MIAIINRGEIGMGIHEYTVGINENILFRFTHKRRDGLSKCLYRAYKAAREFEKSRPMHKKKTLLEILSDISMEVDEDQTIIKDL